MLLDRPPRVVVLDGGMSNALEDRGHDLSGRSGPPACCAMRPRRSPRCTGPTTEAGARVATTASYQASVAGFEAAGLDRVEAEELIAQASPSRARSATDVRRTGRAGGSRLRSGRTAPFSPTARSTAGGTGLSGAELRDFHLPRLELLASAGPDLLAVETIPDVAEAEVLVQLLDDLGVPAWFSFSARGSQTRAGQPLARSLLRCRLRGVRHRGRRQLLRTGGCAARG